MESKFNTDIWRLNNEMVEIMLEVEKSLIELTKALKVADMATMGLLVEKDKAINISRDRIEGECLRIIMKRHPFAKDLRQVLAIFKLISDVERISDNIRDICEGMIANSTIFGLASEKSLDNLFKIGENVLVSISMCIKAFATLDIDTANKVVGYDDVIDELYNNYKDDVSIELEKGAKSPKSLIVLVSAVKHYEKIGDHCVNVAEWVKYILTGERK